MSVSDCIQKVNVSGQAFCSFCIALAKGKKALVSEIDASMKNKCKFWRWLEEKVETSLS